MSNWKHVLSALSFATMISPLAMAKPMSPSVGKIRQPSHMQTSKMRATGKTKVGKAEVSPAQPREPKSPLAPAKKTAKHRRARVGKTKARGKRVKTARAARKGRAKVGAASSMGHRAKRRVVRRA